MTENKPIIIDGVDVSGCDYFCFTKKQECYANDNDYNKSPNCYFKQLKHKEQKLKRIKQVCKDYCKIMCSCETKETCESCINTEILQIIDEVK